MAVVFAADPDLSFVAGLARWMGAPLRAERASGEAEEAEQETLPESEFEAECSALEQKQAFEKLSEKLRTKLQERFCDWSEKEVESAYAIYLQLLVQWELLASNVEALADELSAKTDVRPMLRRSLLVSLYSLVQQFGLVDLRFPVLVRIIKFASASDQLEAVFGGPEGRLASVERWVVDWELGEEQKKELWGLFFDAHSQDGEAVHGYSLKYLDLYDDSADIKAEPLRKRLTQSILLTIRSPSLVSPSAQAAVPPQPQPLSFDPTCCESNLSPPPLLPPLTAHTLKPFS